MNRSYNKAYADDLLTERDAAMGLVQILMLLR